VLWNLIHNALKFTPEEGRITVRAAAQRSVFSLKWKTRRRSSLQTQERVFRQNSSRSSPGDRQAPKGLD